MFSYLYDNFDTTSDIIIAYWNMKISTVIIINGWLLHSHYIMYRAFFSFGILTSMDVLTELYYVSMSNLLLNCTYPI